jgi:hypothetical protein
VNKNYVEEVEYCVISGAIGLISEGKVSGLCNVVRFDPLVFLLRLDVLLAPYFLSQM